VEEYQEVEDGHIVPAGYLRGFANGRMIMRHVVTVKHEKQRREREASVRKVGTRKRPYSRTRPRDGSRIDDVEAMVRGIEERVKVLRNAADGFPFDAHERSVIAQFVGLQYVRGPKWARLYEGRAPDKSALLAYMHLQAFAYTALFFAMRWTVIEFARPSLITCDHPVVMWDEAKLAGAPADLFGTDGRSLVEVRFPLTSTLCLLMTWLGGVDDAEMRPGTKVLARNVNSFTRAAAEDEWFYLPGTSPPFSDGRSRLLPLSAQIFGDYEAGRVAERRAHGNWLWEQTLSQGLQKKPTFEAWYPDPTFMEGMEGADQSSATP
jgi:hypothetical protein